jgi:hypothetical protein
MSTFHVEQRIPLYINVATPSSLLHNYQLVKLQAVATRLQYQAGLVPGFVEEDLWLHLVPVLV